MTFQGKLLCAIAGVTFVALAASAPARALTMQECSAKYKAARAAGTLGGQKWNDFRKAQCGAEATPAAAPAAAAPITANAHAMMGSFLSILAYLGAFSTTLYSA